MRFLADENIYQEVNEYLRELGHNVESPKGLGLFGILDEKILDLAIKKNYIFITQDLDFSDIRFLPKKNSGIIVIRVKPATGENIKKALKEFLKIIKPIQIRNSLIILEEDKFRIRKI